MAQETVTTASRRVLRFVRIDLANGGLIARATLAALDTLELQLNLAAACLKANRWRHVKRGSVYGVETLARLQCAAPVAEGVELVIYRGDDGHAWARPRAEFEDGRFVRLSEEQS